MVKSLYSRTKGSTKRITTTIRKVREKGEVIEEIPVRSEKRGYGTVPKPPSEILNILARNPLHKQKVNEFQEKITEIKERAKKAKKKPQKAQIMYEAARLLRSIEDLAKSEFGQEFRVKRNVRTIHRDIVGKDFRKLVPAHVLLGRTGLIDYEGKLIKRTREGSSVPHYKVPYKQVTVSHNEFPYVRSNLVEDFTPNHIRLITALSTLGGFYKATIKQKGGTRTPVWNFDIKYGNMQNYDYIRHNLSSTIRELTGLTPSYTVIRKYFGPEKELKIRKRFKTKGYEEVALNLTSQYLGTYLESLGMKPGGKNISTIPKQLVNKIIEDEEYRRAALGTIVDIRGKMFTSKKQQRIQLRFPESEKWLLKALEQENIDFDKPKRFEKARSIGTNIPESEVPRFFEKVQPQSAYLVIRTSLAFSGIKSPPNFDECVHLFSKNINKIKKQAPWIIPHVKRVMPEIL
jgi:hypothetical protein